MYEIYLSELAKGAKDLGYGIAIGKYGNPELAHITREQIEHFSRRSRDVETALQSGGRTRETSTAAAKRAAALSTRAAKQRYDHAALRMEWRERGQRVGLLRFLPTEEPRLSAGKEAENARSAVGFALEHLSERHAAFTRNDLTVEALRAARGSVASRAISAELDRQIGEGGLVSDAPGEWLTTRTALESERRLLSIEYDGRGAVTAIAANVHSAAEPGAQKLNAGQRALVGHVLNTRNRVIGVQGLAGTGKTTALTVARELAEREGFELVGLAPSHSAVRALKKSGIESQTVKRWMLDTDAGSQLTPFSIVVLDEAGLAGTATLRSVLERVERAGARAVLIGDTHQYESVDAGRGFAQLQDHGMQTAQLSQMVRQREARLAKAARLAVDQPARALGLLPIVEDANPASRHARIARDFAALSPSARADTLLLTGSHEARRDINERVRVELGLAGTGEHLRVFRPLDRTTAQKKQLETYQPGFTLRFEKNYRSFGARRGDTALIERIFADAIVVTLADGTSRTMSPDRLSGKGWSVGVTENLEVAVGDRVRFTGTNPQANYRNGERGVIEGFDADVLTIRRSDGSILSVARDQALSLDYGYAVTGHSAQGLDASRVVLEKDTQSRTTNRRSFYTDVTRARDAAVVVTDSVPRLAQDVNVDRANVAALEIVTSSE